jgi:hypothetical protein
MGLHGSREDFGLRRALPASLVTLATSGRCRQDESAVRSFLSSIYGGLPAGQAGRGEGTRKSRFSKKIYELTSTNNE